MAVAALAVACGSSSDSGDLDGFAFSLGVSELDFGAVAVGSTIVRRVAVQNTGNQSIEILAEETDGFSEDFRFSPSRVALDAGATTEVEVTFRPTSAGIIRSTLRFRSTQAGVSQATIALSGEGTDGGQIIGASSRRIDFGLVVVSSTETRELVLTNTGAGQLRVRVDLGTNVGICGEPSGDVSDFCVDPRGRIDINQRITMEAEEAVSFQVFYQPSAPDPRSTGQIRFRACDNCAELSIDLEGQAANSGLVCDADLDFGRVFPDTCRTAEVTCANQGNLSTTIFAFGPRPGRPLPIEFKPARLTEPVQVEPGASVGLTIDFCPDDTSETTDIARIDSRDAIRETSFEVNLVGQGGGPRPVVSPTAIEFGPTALIAPNGRTITLSNVGFDDLIIRQINVDTATTGAFAATTPVGSIAPGQSISFELSFQPTQLGPVSSQVRIDFEEVGSVSVSLSGEGVNLPPCSFQVESEIDFGAVAAGEVRQTTVLVRNNGPSDCLLYRLAPLPQTDAAFEVVGTASVTTTLPAGMARPVQVRLLTSDQVGMLTGGFEVQASSPSEPRRAVTLRANVLDASVVFGPHILDFGVVTSTCGPINRTVRIRNPLTALVEISSAQVVQTNGTNAFRLGTMSFPLTLNPNSSAMFDVELAAATEGTATGFVELAGTINGQPVVFRVPLNADVQRTPQRQETFRQGHAEVDVLAAFSMTFRGGAFNNTMRNSWTDFAAALVRDGVDYRVGVTSTDIQMESGRFLPSDGTTNRVMTPATMSPATVWAQRFRSSSGFAPTGTSGFEAVRRALSRPLLTMSNRNFRRPTKPLEIMIVNPEADGSPSDLPLYLDALASGFLPGQQNDWRISGLAVPGATSSCNGAFGFGFSNSRLEAAAVATGGNFVNWCQADGEAIIQALGEAVSGLRADWRLAQAPVPSSIEVRVNGASVPAVDNGVPNWRYNALSQSVDFTQASVPRVGELIEVDYRPACPQ